MIDTTTDTIAQESAFRHIHPGTKLLLALGCLVICLLSPSPLIPLIAGLILSIVLIIPGRVCPRLYGTLLLGPAVFTLVSVVILLFMRGGGEVLWEATILPGISLSVTTGAVHECTLVLSRVFGCTVALFFIVLTTPMTDLFNGMKRTGLPVEVIDLMMIIYRYIFITYSQALEIWQAQVMRLGYSRPVEAVRSFSTLCGMLFISSLNAGEDLVRAMDCRCYSGIFPALDQAEPVRIKSLVPVLLFLAFLSGLLAIVSGVVRLS